jgi:hypothetical protein
MNYVRRANAAIELRGALARHRAIDYAANLASDSELFDAGDIQREANP